MNVSRYMMMHQITDLWDYDYKMIAVDSDNIQECNELMELLADEKHKMRLILISEWNQLNTLIIADKDYYLRELMNQIRYKMIKHVADDSGIIGLNKSITGAGDS
jgi:hypothetical protein